METINIPVSLRRSTIEYLIETVALVVEMSGQSKAPTASVCFPDEICGLCSHLGHDPWVLLKVYRKAKKPGRNEQKEKKTPNQTQKNCCT
jgi:hypothetical protein